MRCRLIILLLLFPNLLSAEKNSGPLLPEQEFCLQVLRLARRSATDREQNIRMDGPGVLADRHTALFEPSVRIGIRPGNELTEEFRIYPNKASTIAGTPDYELRQLAVQVEAFGAKLYFDPDLKGAEVQITSDAELRMVIPKDGLSPATRVHEMRHVADVFEWAGKLKAADPSLSDKQALVFAYSYVSTPKGIEWLELRAIRAEFEEHILNSIMPVTIKDAAKFADELNKLTNYPESEALKRVVYLHDNRLHAETEPGMAARDERILKAAVDQEFDTLVAEIARNLIRRYLGQRKMLADMHADRARARERAGQIMAANAHREAAAEQRAVPATFEGLFNGTWLDQKQWAQIKPIVDSVYLAQRFGVLEMLDGPRVPISPNDIEKRWKEINPGGPNAVNTAMLVRYGNDPASPLQLLLVKPDSVALQPDGTAKIAVRKRDRDTEKKLTVALRKLEGPKDVRARFATAPEASEINFGGASDAHLIGWITLPPTASGGIWR